MQRTHNSHGEYIHIREKLNELQNKEEVTEFTKQAIYATIIHVIELIAQKYDKVRKGVEETMGGKETEERAKDMLRDKMALRFTFLPAYH